jgi:DNA-directed RNA polymerase specialized sigma24 family protein
MSPLALRRYRAERMLSREFEGLRERVIATTRSRLRARGVLLDAGELEACYSQAWQGLYAAVLEGQEIANPTGWLALVTFRRAIDEHRARRRLGGGANRERLCACAEDGHLRADDGTDTFQERDFASELDDLMRLRQLFEALRGRLSARELQAATLCYLQGLSRAEAAARMGVSERRMGKLMEGEAGRPGVAGKVGALVETIRAGSWCEAQGSLMRGLAYGILDPAGERYQLAMIHAGECPACRAYVLSLRGLAAVLPPVPWLLHWALAGAGAGAGAVGAGTGAGVGTGAFAPAGGGAGGAAAASGAAGAGAAGGGWLLVGGPVGAKLTVGCLLALGVGVGCAALTERPHAPRSREVARVGQSRPARATPGASSPAVPSGAGGELTNSSAAGRPSPSASLTPARRASREFGPELALAGSVSGVPASPRHAPPTATLATAAGERRTVAQGAGEGVSPEPTRAPAAGGSGGTSAAQREFSPG